MARRRRKHLLDDGADDSDSSLGSPNEADDGADAEGGWNRKRQRMSKEQAIYGIFADEEGEDNTRRGGLGSRAKNGKVNYSRGQAFVAASKKNEDEDDDQDSDEDDSDEAGIIEGGSDSDSSAEGRNAEDDDDEDDEEALLEAAEEEARAPATEAELLETRSGLGGPMGPTAEAAGAKRSEEDPDGFRPASFVSSRGGIGSGAGRGGIGSSSAAGIGATGRGGIGSGAAPGLGSTAGLGAGRGGIGSGGSSTAGLGSRAGLGAATSVQRPQHASFEPSALSSAGMPTSFGASVQPSTAFSERPSEQKPRSFLPSKGGGAGAASAKPAISFKGSFDPVKLMAQMGWRAGQGLGKQGEGMINPIEVQLRPERAGIAFGGRKEKTKQAREEARRRGEEVESSEDERDKRRRAKKGTAKGGRTAIEQQQPARASWLKAEKKPRAPKVEYRSYEQILEDVGAGGGDVSVDVGQIIDATGASGHREVSNLASAVSSARGAAGAPTADDKHLPELMHNLATICDANRTALDALAREGARIQDRAKWLRREHDESVRRKEKAQKEAERIEGLLTIVRELEGAQPQRLEDLDPLVQRLVDGFQADVVRENLDEALVGAMAVLFKRHIADWRPLEEPELMTASLKRWRKVLLREGDPALAEGVQHRSGAQRVMTAFETLVWNVWMPPIRSAVNNEWKPSRPERAIALLDAWRPLLPRFVVDNVVDQLLLPKVRSAVSAWDARDLRTGAPSLHHLVFPWLPVLGEERMDDILADAKRKIKSVLKAWKVGEAVPKDLDRWRETFSSSEWDGMMLNSIVPKLSSHLRRDLEINPAAQKMAPFEAVLSWRPPLLRPSILSRLLETEFFPKWLGTLHLWLTRSSANLGEVAQWYSYWKGRFPSDVASLPGVQLGFRRAQELMAAAADMVERGQDRSKLPKPDTTPLSRSSAQAKEALDSASAKASATAANLSSRQQQRVGRGAPQPDEGEASVSFRKIVEEAAAEASLFVVPANRLHEGTALPMLRLVDDPTSLTKSGGGGASVAFYIDDDVLFVEVREATAGPSQAKPSYEPVRVQDLIRRALAQAQKSRSK